MLEHFIKITDPDFLPDLLNVGDIWPANLVTAAWCVEEHKGTYSDEAGGDATPPWVTAPPGNTPTPSTSATAGTPGSFNNDVPATLSALTALGALGATTAWAAGEYVDLGDHSKASWDGAKWVSGAVPAAAAADEPAPDAEEEELK